MSHPTRSHLTPLVEQESTGEGRQTLDTCISKTFHFISTVSSILTCVGLSATFAYYIYSLHENELWFSNISDIEREISFRTESGLYYSYFKEFFTSSNSSVEEVLHRLMHEKRTEYPRQINILQRFNIFQEVLIALLYRLLSYSALITLPTPILFYTNACFFFSGLLHFSLFSLSWKLGSHWSYGLLTSAFLHSHLEDVTRTFFTINLRENFALPFFFLQNFFVIHLLSDITSVNLPKSIARQLNYFYNLQSIAASTFFFSLFWQINQYILAIQSTALLTILFFCGINQKNNIANILIAQSVGHLLVFPIQFLQPMLLVSLNLVLNFSILLSLRLIPLPNAFSLKNVLMRLLFIMGLTIFLQFCLKLLLRTESDTHIIHFLLTKFSVLNVDVPFESALYICHGAFTFLDFPEMVMRTQKSGVLFLYILILIKVVFLTTKNIIIKGQFCISLRFLNASLLYLTVQSMICGIFAILTMRLKYLWFPQVCVLAAYGSSVIDKVIGRWARISLVCAISTGLLWRQYGDYAKQMSNEKEFYDPDTVELMEWIKSVKHQAVFAGSMQLMAGVRACTSQPIANHPHFEDKWLRQRTERLYQIYGRRPVEDVYKILKSESVTNIIVEDSICLARSDGCSTNDLVDLVNLHQDDSMSSRFTSRPRRKSEEPRFCDKIRDYGWMSNKLFKLVFENKTFRVYKIIEIV